VGNASDARLQHVSDTEFVMVHIATRENMGNNEQYALLANVKHLTVLSNVAISLSSNNTDKCNVPKVVGSSDTLLHFNALLWP
jgi:hypothetical protein